MQKGLAPILIVVLIALFLGGFLIYQKQISTIPQQLPPTSPIQCKICLSREDICPGNYSCFMPAASSKGVCVPVPKLGEKYTINQINKICNTTFPEE